MPAQRALLEELTAALGEGNITLAKENAASQAIDWQVANAAMTSDTFCSHYCHECGDSVSAASTWEAPTDANSGSCVILHALSLLAHPPTRTPARSRANVTPHSLCAHTADCSACLQLTYFFALHLFLFFTRDKIVPIRYQRLPT